MTVIPQTRPEDTAIAGVAHSTWAAADEGLSQLSVWRQTLAPGAASPPHRHDCDEVVLCLAGQGEVHTEGRVHRFGADTTVALPRHQLHQLFNVGDEPLQLLAVLGATPVTTVLPDGQVLELPWRS
jgi:quercetin dioxygenase-like cupin family protein